jgi:hypothetical protein
MWSPPAGRWRVCWINWRASGRWTSRQTGWNIVQADYSHSSRVSLFGQNNTNLGSYIYSAKVRRFCRLIRPIHICINDGISVRDPDLFCRSGSGTFTCRSGSDLNNWNVFIDKMHLQHHRETTTYFYKLDTLFNCDLLIFYNKICLYGSWKFFIYL